MTQLPADRSADRGRGPRGRPSADRRCRRSSSSWTRRAHAGRGAPTAVVTWWRRLPRGDRRTRTRFGCRRLARRTPAFAPRAGVTDVTSAHAVYVDSLCHVDATLPGACQPTSSVCSCSSRPAASRPRTSWRASSRSRRGRSTGTSRRSHSLACRSTPSAGPTGGIRLVDGYRTRLTGLTNEEADALFLSGLPGPAAELGLGTVVAAARLKVLAALPPELRTRASRISQTLPLRRAGLVQTAARPRPTSRHSRAPSGRAVGSTSRIGATGKPTSRPLDPLGLVLKAGTWYLVAVSAGSTRTYRVSRVLAVTVLERAVRAPRALRPRDVLDGLDRRVRAGAAARSGSRCGSRPARSTPSRITSSAQATPARGTAPGPTTAANCCASRSSGTTRRSLRSSTSGRWRRSSIRRSCGIGWSPARSAILERYAAPGQRAATV